MFLSIVARTSLPVIICIRAHAGNGSDHGAPWGKGVSKLGVVTQKAMVRMADLRGILRG